MQDTRPLVQLTHFALTTASPRDIMTCPVSLDSCRRITQDKAQHVAIGLADGVDTCRGAVGRKLFLPNGAPMGGSFGSGACCRGVALAPRQPGIPAETPAFE